MDFKKIRIYKKKNIKKIVNMKIFLLKILLKLLPKLLSKFIIFIAAYIAINKQNTFK